VLATDVRSRIRVTDLPSWLPPGPVDLYVDGYRETLEPHRWVVEYNCVPGSPWLVGEVGDDELGRADTTGAELAAPVGAADTTISVATTAGPLWTTDPAGTPFDIQVGGEVMRVTAVTGASSPQTFTVTRSVNGITKQHTSGAEVRLAQPAITAL